MKDYSWRIFRRIVGRNLHLGRNRFKGVGTTKRNIIVAITLVLVMRLFFYTFPRPFAQAELSVPERAIAPEVIDPLNKVKDIDAKTVDLEEWKTCSENNMSKDNYLLYSDKTKKHNEEDYMAILKDYPMADMVPYIADLDRKTASFMIGIAKKESDWGKHVPTRNGRDCYNYWGYKGSYNLTLGYSCFDSPQQAVEVVSGKISQLIDKKINTPEKMVVWKCGSSCAGHDPQGVKSWIGTVKTYWEKLVS